MQIETAGLVVLEMAKFGQHVFSESSNNQKNQTNTQEQRQKPRFEPNRYGGDSKIVSMHKERIQTAGRVGTKRFVDPCKVFLGNLPFHVTPTVLQEWLCTQMGLPREVLLKECKIVYDWKTGTSKGYGFAVFTEAVYGTVCIDKCNGRELEGRKVRVDQGRKKMVDPQIFVQKKNKQKRPMDEEERLIEESLDAASGNTNGSKAAMEEQIFLDPEAAALFKRLDPDLLEGMVIATDEGEGMDIETSFSDEELFGDEEEEDDFDDGVFEEDDSEVVVFEEPNMNREQRRKAARGKKKRKLPHKGFGSV